MRCIKCGKIVRFPVPITGKTRTCGECRGFAGGKQKTWKGEILI